MTSFKERKLRSTIAALLYSVVISMMVFVSACVASGSC